MNDLEDLAPQNSQQGPSVRADKTAMVVFNAVGVVAVLALVFSAHLPSPLGVRISQVVSAAAALLVLWEGRRGGVFSLDNSRYRARVQGAWIAKHAWLRVPALSLGVGF